MYSYNPYYANYLAHFGIKGKSGRYPYGSGDRPYQHDPHAKKRYKAELKADRKKAKILTGTAAYAAKETSNWAQQALYSAAKADKYNSKLNEKAKYGAKISNRELKKANRNSQSAIGDTRIAEFYAQKYKEKKDELVKFHDEMIKKYGKENVKDIPMKNFKLKDPVTKEITTIKMVNKGNNTGLVSAIVAAGFGAMAGISVAALPALAPFAPGMSTTGIVIGSHIAMQKNNKYAKYL